MKNHLFKSLNLKFSREEIQDKKQKSNELIQFEFYRNIFMKTENRKIM